MTAESPAATTEGASPGSDDAGLEVQPGAESAPAVSDTDEVNREAKTGVSKRIDELTRNWREAERREQTLLELLGRDRAQKSVPEPAEESPKPGKSLADFQYDEGKYHAHLMKEAREEAVRAAREELQREQEQGEAVAREAAHAEREEAFAAKTPDYREVAYNRSLPITQDMAATIMESENGPQIAYHLGKNPSLAAQIARLPPLQQAREIGRIEARLTTQPPPKVSGAPPPAPKLPAGEGTPEKDPKDWSDSDFAKWRKRFSKK